MNSVTSEMEFLEFGAKVAHDTICKAGYWIVRNRVARNIQCLQRMEIKKSVRQRSYGVSVQIEEGYVSDVLKRMAVDVRQVVAAQVQLF